MTTIAYRNGIMAADDMMTRGNEPVYGAHKIFRTNHFLVGMSGSFSNMEPFKNLLKIHESPDFNPVDLWVGWEDLPSFGDGFCAIIVNRRGTIWSSIDAPPVLVPTDFDAIGSGACYAMGAMGAGYSAMEAVDVAMRFDTNTGGVVRARSFDD